MLSWYPPRRSYHVLARVVAAVVRVEGLGHQEGRPVVPQGRMQPELGYDDDILLELLGGKVECCNGRVPWSRVTVPVRAYWCTCWLCMRPQKT